MKDDYVCFDCGDDATRLVSTDDGNLAVCDDCRPDAAVISR